MSNNTQNQYDDFDEFDDDEFDNEQPPKPAGNDLIKQLRKQLRQADKRMKELETENTSFRSESRSRTVAQILEAEGVKPSIAKYIPSDITDKDAIVAWLDQNADDFGITKGSRQGEPDPDEDAYRRMNNTTDGALSPSQIDDIYRQIDKAESIEEINALMAQLN